MLFSGALERFLDNESSEAALLESVKKNKDRKMTVIWDL